MGVLGGVIFAVAVIASIAMFVVQRYVYCAGLCVNEYLYQKPP